MNVKTKAKTTMVSNSPATREDIIFGAVLTSVLTRQWGPHEDMEALVDLAKKVSKDVMNHA